MIARIIYKPAEFHFNYREFAVVDSVQQKCGGKKLRNCQHILLSKQAVCGISVSCGM